MVDSLEKFISSEEASRTKDGSEGESKTDESAGFEPEGNQNNNCTPVTAGKCILQNKLNTKYILFCILIYLDKHTYTKNSPAVLVAYALE